MVQIQDLEVRQGDVDIVIEIVEVGEIKEFQKFDKSGRVATAKAKDETGEIKLSLWNEQIDQIKAGDKVHITNGYVNEFQGEKQLTTGKFGKLEVVGKSEGATEEKEGIVEKAKDVVEDVKEKVEEVVEAVEEKLHLKKEEAPKPEEKKEEPVVEEKIE
ncbi:hypothetical protein GOV06_05155 [Candidatus Woesearchaeota archaeon]|nr:hypothetical protein [Candidatus Woesearchaeota archaeon]